MAGGLPPGGQGPRGPGHTLCRGRREKRLGEAVGGGIEQRVRRAAQRRRLPGVGHHVREGAARAEAGDDAALPAVVGPPVEHSPSHQRGAQVAGRRRLDRKACRRDRRWRAGGAEERRRAGEGAPGRLLEGGNGGLRFAVGQVVERLPRVARSIKACPANQHVRPPVPHLELELEQLLPLVLGTLSGQAAGGGSSWPVFVSPPSLRWLGRRGLAYTHTVQGCVASEHRPRSGSGPKRRGAEALGRSFRPDWSARGAARLRYSSWARLGQPWSEVGAQSLDVVLWEDAPRRGYVEPVHVWCSARDVGPGSQRVPSESAPREGRVLHVDNDLTLAITAMRRMGAGLYRGRLGSQN